MLKIRLQETKPQALLLPNNHVLVQLNQKYVWVLYNVEQQEINCKPQTGL